MLASSYSSNTLLATEDAAAAAAGSAMAGREMRAEMGVGWCRVAAAADAGVQDAPGGIGRFMPGHS